MATIVNERDIILQAASPRLVSVTLPDNIVVPAIKGIELTAPSLTFQVTTAGTASPASIVLTATLKQVVGTVTFSVTAGTATLTGTGGSRTLSYASMSTDSVTIRASVTEGVTTYTADLTIAKVRDGAAGTSGTNGIDGIDGSLSSASAALPASSAGVVSSYAGAETTLKITEGATDTSALWAYHVSATSGGVAYRDSDDSDDSADRSATGPALGGLGGVNMRPQSQALDNAAWSKVGITVGANNQTAPDGTLTADTLTNTVNSSSYMGQALAMAVSTTYTDSLYVKPLTANKVLSMAAYTGLTNVSCLFDLTGMTASATAGTSGLIADVGGGWYRLSFTFTTAGSGAPLTTWLYLGSGSGIVNASVSFAMWGAQLEPGSAAGPYRATDAAARSGTPGYLKITSLTQSLSWLDITAVRLGYASVTRRYSVAQAVAGASTPGTPGARGSLTGYGNAYGLYLFSGAWLDNSTGSSTMRANRVISNMLTGAVLTSDLATTDHLRIGDTVTLTDAASATTAVTKYWSGSGWVTPGMVLDGNLLVNGTVSASQLNVQSGSVGVTIAGSTPIANAAGAAITNGAYIYQSSTTLYGLYARNFAAGGVGYFESAGGTTIDAFHNSALTGAAGTFRSNSANAGAVGLYAIGYHGARISNPGQTQVGLIGTSAGKCFYAETGTFGPFTGAHDALILRGADIAAGDIVTDHALLARKGISDTLFEVRRSTGPSQKAAVGVLCEMAADWSGFVPASLVCGYEEADGAAMRQPIPAPGYDVLLADYQLATVNGVGEGQINVCGEGGDLEVGDLIVTSSMPGKGMRQSDDVVRSITVAKCREAVTFTGPGDVRLVACIYLCG